LDDSINYGMHMDELIQKISKQWCAILRI
jgi:ribosome-binding factor A